MNREEYDRLVRERQEIISENKARRMRKYPPGEKPGPLPVPPKPEKPLVPVAYRKEDDSFEGRLNDADECPADCYVKWEPIVW